MPNPSRDARDAKHSASVPDPSGCLPEHGCITCGDEAVPLKVLEVEPTGLALCENADGERTEIEVALVGPVGPGDAILAHAGTAIAMAPEGAFT